MRYANILDKILQPGYIGIITGVIQIKEDLSILQSSKLQAMSEVI